MNTHIALLRGINVGGRNKLPMADLRDLLAEMGLNNVKTYIQSGNVVFQSERTDVAALAQEIGEAIEQRHGFAPRVLLLDAEAVRSAMAANPFPEAEAEPKTLHLYFLAEQPENPEVEMLDQLKTESERFQLGDQVFYLHAPDGIGRSKLAERAERTLGVAATARNWRTVSKVMELVESGANVMDARLAKMDARLAKLWMTARRGTLGTFVQVADRLALSQTAAGWRLRRVVTRTTWLPISWDGTLR